MDTGASLATFLVLGLAGSVHCAGMCGGFALAVAAAPAARRRRILARELVFVTGKAVTYAMMGAGVALAGARAASWGGLQDLRAVAAWLAGGALVLAGLALSGLHLPRPPLPAGASRAVGELARTWRGVLGAEGYVGPLGAGLLLGFLPCGLSWSALLLAATMPAPTAGAGLFLFGLGTAPVLVGAGLGWRALEARHRRVAARALGPLLVVLGLYTGLRGGVPGVPEAQAVLPDCCVEEAP